MPLLTLDEPREVVRVRKPTFRDPRPDDYAWKVRHTRPESLIGYWPLDEVSGTVAHDLSGRRHNGTYVGVDLGRQGIGDGRTCPYFDGVNDYVNIYSAGLAAAFNGAEGSALVWIRGNATVWADGVYRALLCLYAAGTDYVIFYKMNTANLFSALYQAGGVRKTLDYATKRLDWFSVGLTWSSTNDLVRLFVDGVVVASGGGLGTWSGSPVPVGSIIGADGLAPNCPFSGNEAHAALYNCALSAQEIERLGRLD